MWRKTWWNLLFKGLVAEGDNLNGYPDQTIYNTSLCDITKIINIMKEQESGDSLLSQNSAELPDLESIRCVEQGKQGYGNNCKKEEITI